MGGEKLGVHEFEADPLRLSANQKKVLSKLVEAARLIALIYKLQGNHRYNGANFYPHDASREEVEKAAAS